MGYLILDQGEYFNNFFIVNKILESLNLDSNRISYVEDRATVMTLGMQLILTSFLIQDGNHKKV